MLLLEGAMNPGTERRRCRGAFSLGFYNDSEHLPSKTLSKIAKKWKCCQKHCVSIFFCSTCFPWPREPQGAQGPPERAPGSPRDSPRDLQVQSQRPQGPPDRAPGNPRDPPRDLKMEPQRPQGLTGGFPAVITTAVITTAMITTAVIATDMTTRAMIPQQ